MSLLAELRRRNVIRMAGLYLVGAWLVVQVAETLLPIFGTPAWVLKSIVVIAAIGFVPALAFAWVFELTPDGLKRERDVVRAEGDERVDRTARKLDVAVIVLLLAIGGLMVWQREAPESAATTTVAADAKTGADAAAGAAGADNVDDPAASTDAVDAATHTPEPASIAVLPFVNMSTDAENGYFADGISEELLNVLAGIDGLTVASRTSSFSFKGKDTSIPEIAAALGVRHVLEGSVRRQGDKVRITAQLIRAGTDRHLWSQTYDRDLVDIFEVQEEIAQAIADEMIDLLPTATTVQVPAATDDIAAYELMLRGRSRFFRRDELLAARTDLEQAVARDPTLGEAWLYLAGVHYVLPGYDDAVDYTRSYAQAREALLKARELLPEHAMVAALEGALAIDSGDFRGGLVALERAAAMPSTDSTPKMWHGLTLLGAGYIDEAVAALEKAQQADPLVGITNGYLGLARLAAGDEAQGAADVALGASQGWDAGVFIRAHQLAARGDTAGALATLPPLASDPADRFNDSEMLFRAALRDRRKVDAYLAGFGPTDFDESLLAFGLVDEFLGHWNAALDAAAPDTPLGQSRWTLRIVWMPETRAMREDPRFFAIARRIGLVELWEERGWPDGCRREGERLECE